MLTDSVLRFRKKAMVIVIAQTVGTFMQASGIALILGYINLLETGSSFTIWRFTFEPDAVSFVYVALAIVVFFIVAGWLLLWSRLKTLDVGFDYIKFCSQRVFNIYFRNRFSPRFNKRYDKSKISSLAGGVSFRCGRALRMLLEAVRPAVISVIAAAVVLRVNPFLSLIIGGLALATVIFQYRISRDVARYSVLREEYTPGSSQSRKEILDEAVKFPSTMEGSSFERTVAGKFGSESITSYYRAFTGWLAGGAKSGFVGDILMAVSIFLVLVILVGDVLRTGEGWTGVIAYVIALNFAFSNLRGLTTSITGINRFYPQIRRYKNYVDEFAQPQDEARKRAALIHLDRGSVYSLVMQKGLTLHAFLQKLDFSAESGIAYIGADFPFDDISFAESLGMRELSQQDYWAVIRNTDLAELFQKDVIELATEDRPVGWAGLDSRLVFLTMLVTFVESPAAYAIVNVAEVKSISRPTWDYILSLMREKTVVINHNNSLDGIGDYAEKAVVFLHDKKFDIFTVDEFNSNKSSIKAQLRGPAAPEDDKTRAGEAAEIDATEGESTEEEGF